MLANREMATPVLGMRRKGDVEVPRHERLRVQHPLPPQGESIERALIITRIGVGPLREGRKGGLHKFQRVLNVMVCQEHTSASPAATPHEAATSVAASRSVSHRTPGGLGLSRCPRPAVDAQSITPAAAVAYCSAAPTAS